MKAIAKTTMLIGSMLMVGTAVAEFNPHRRFNVGGDYYHAWMEGKGNTSLSGVGVPYNQLIPRSFGGGTLYLGARLFENFGLELGGSASAKKTKAYNLPNSVGITTTKARRISSYFDLVFIKAINDCIDFNVSLGIGFVKPKVEGSYVLAATRITQGISFAIRGRSVLRAGLGVSYQLTDIVGLRAKLGWEGTSALRGNINNTGSAKIFKDTLGMSLGIFARF